MFPSFKIEPQEINEAINKQKPSEIGKVFKFNFDTNNYAMENGKLVEASKIEATKQHISWILKTQIGKFEIYGSDYGIDRNIYIGNKTLSAGFIQSELKRQIEEELIKHPYIERIENFNHHRASNNLFVEFDVITTLGENLNVREVI